MDSLPAVDMVPRTQFTPEPARMLTRQSGLAPNSGMSRWIEKFAFLAPIATYAGV